MSATGREHLDRLRESVLHITREVEELTTGLEAEALLWRPGPERWSVADCLEHLITTGDAYHPRIRSALEAAPPAGPSATYRPRLFGRAFLWFSSPRGRFRIRARGAFVPPASDETTPARFRGQQQELLELIEAAHGRDLQRSKVPSPLSPLLTLTLGECLHLLTLHQMRHLDQARRVMGAPGFPKRDRAEGGQEGDPPQREP